MQTIELNDQQTCSLERQIEDAYAREELHVYGLEVSSIELADDSTLPYEYKIWYSYEDEKNREHNTNGYFKLCLCALSVTDLSFAD